MKIIVILSVRFSTVERLFLAFLPGKFYRTTPHPEGPIPWDSFFLPFCNIKTLTVHPKRVPDIAHSLLPIHGPDILPVLKEIRLLKPHWGLFPCPSGSAESMDSTSNAFQPFIASHQQAGHSVTVSSNVLFNQCGK
jgi:hypothetical protein